MFIKKHQYTLVFSVLIAISIVLAALITFGGPRVSRTILYESLDNQRFVITFNSPIENISSPISIHPEIPFETRISGRQITISFREPLAYATTYELSLSVTDDRTKSSNVTTSFDTRNPDMFYMKRSATGNDTIYQTKLNDIRSEVVVFSHPRILEFTVGESTLLVLTETNETRKLHLINRSEKEITLPNDDTIVGVDGTPQNNTFLITLQDQKFQLHSWLYISENDSWTEVVQDIGGSLTSSQASFTPDGETITYFDQNQALILDDPTDDRDGVSLGIFDAKRRFLPNMSGIFGSRSNQYVTISAEEGVETPAPEPIQTSFLPFVFNNQQDYVYIQQSFDSLTEQLTQNIRTLINDTVTDIAAYSTDERLVLGMSISPNDEFFMTEEALQPVIYDNAPLNNKPQNVITRIRSTQSGDIIRQLDGFDIIFR